jgi:hypothetical protein
MAQNMEGMDTSSITMKKLGGKTKVHERQGKAPLSRSEMSFS